jgi:hypothetical protein
MNRSGHALLDDFGRATDGIAPDGGTLWNAVASRLLAGKVDVPVQEIGTMLRPALMIGVALAALGAAPAFAQSNTSTTTTTTTQQTNSGILAMKVGDLEDKDVYGADGQEVGEIDEVVRGNGQIYAVLEAGGNWLDMGEEKILVPISQFTLQGDKLTLPMTEQQATSLPKWQDGNNEFAAVEDDDQTLGEAQASR